MTAGAVLSADRVYRYRLWREWDAALPRACYIMLNPSTADENADDATIRVCKGRAMRLGMGGIDVVNLFALRSTQPSALYDHPAPISHPDEPTRAIDELVESATRSMVVICAWGTHGALRSRGRDVLLDLTRRGIKAHAIKINADGSPAHPLRISYDEPLKLLTPSRARGGGG